MINNVVLVGRLCTEPELRQTPNGVSVCTFRLAVQRSYAPRGGERQTDFLSIVVWRNQAEFVHNYFHKGNMIGVVGHIETRNYTDRNNQQRYAFEIIAENVSFVEGKSSASSGGDFGGGNSFAGNAGPASYAPPVSSQPAPAPAGNVAPQQPASNFSSGDFGDFQEIDSDEDLPF